MKEEEARGGRGRKEEGRRRNEGGGEREISKEWVRE